MLFEIKSDRLRNGDNQYTGCQFRYSVDYKLKPNSDTDKHLEQPLDT